jgi:hypothetical protein
MLDCTKLSDDLGPFKGCMQTAEGLRVATDCLLPSFEQVHVYVVSFGGGYIVHDGAAAARSAWAHGVDHQAISADIAFAARAFSCSVKDNQISLTAASRDWLWSAIASVANASAEAARRSVGKAKPVKERSLIGRARRAIENGTPSASVLSEYPIAGSSGRQYKVDLGVVRREHLSLVEAVSAHPTSVAFKHQAFSDIDLGRRGNKFIVHSDDLGSADRVLLSNVADLISLSDQKVEEGWNVFAGTRF